MARPAPMPTIEKFFLATDWLSSRLAHWARACFLWPVLYAVALGDGLFIIRHLSWVPLIDNNAVPLQGTYDMTKWAAVAFLGVWGLYGAAIAAHRLRRGTFRCVPTIELVNAHLCPLLALPLLARLVVPGLEKESAKETLFYIGLVALAFGLGVYSWARHIVERPKPAPPTETATGDAEAAALPDDDDELREEMPPWFSHTVGLTVFALWIAYAVFFSRLSITNHHALNTRTTDLGYYDNIFFQSIHGKPLGCSFIRAGYHGSAHFDPILVLLSPLYLIYPHPELLLVLQSVWLGSGVIPIYLFTKHKLNSELCGVALAFMYVVHPALHGMNMYEFHSLSLLAPLFVWLLYCLETERITAYWLLVVLVLLCREDVPLMLVFVGVFALLKDAPAVWKTAESRPRELAMPPRGPRFARIGWLTVLVSVLYFALVKGYFQSPHGVYMAGQKPFSYDYYYEDLIPNKNGIVGLVISLVTNPLFVLKTLIADAKVVYALTMFLPMLFLPLFALRARVCWFTGFSLPCWRREPRCSRCTSNMARHSFPSPSSHSRLRFNRSRLARS